MFNCFVLFLFCLSPAIIDMLMGQSNSGMLLHVSILLLRAVYYLLQKVHPCMSLSLIYIFHKENSYYTVSFQGDVFMH